jgi:hypothetical protein
VKKLAAEQHGGWMPHLLISESALEIISKNRMRVFGVNTLIDKLLSVVFAAAMVAALMLCAAGVFDP